MLRYSPRAIYRLGIAAANGEVRKAGGKRFAELPADAQDGFLQGMEKNAIQFATVPAPVFFSQLLANTNIMVRGVIGWRCCPSAKATRPNG
jgi:gluconate 2-dehydrogenase gamma chain